MTSRRRTLPRELEQERGEELGTGPHWLMVNTVDDQVRLEAVEGRDPSSVCDRHGYCGSRIAQTISDSDLSSPGVAMPVENQKVRVTCGGQR